MEMQRFMCCIVTLLLFTVSFILLQFSDNGEERVVVGTLDLNQCLRLPDEITGMKPEVFDHTVTA